MNYESYITGQQSTTLFVGGHGMTGISGSSTGSGSEQTVVVVEVPGGREFVWPSPRADMVSWQVGERVSYMGSRWRVVSRTNGPSDVLTLKLAPEG
jgi:hypothetical protein